MADNGNGMPSPFTHRMEYHNLHASSAKEGSMFALFESSMALFVADATDGDITIATTADDNEATTQHSKKILDAAVHNIIIFFGYHRRRVHYCKACWFACAGVIKRWCS